MSTVSRINKSGLTMRARNQLRKGAAEAQSIKVLGTTYTHTADTTALQDVTGFKLPVTAGVTYKFTASLILTANAASGAKFAITGPTASYLTGQVQVDGTSTSAVSLATLAGGATAAAVEAFAVGTYKATANGDFQVQIALNTGTTGDTAIIAGSFIQLEQVIGA